MPPMAERLSGLMPVLALVGCLAAVIAAVGLWRLASETGERACIERAEASYPAVAVSSTTQRNSPVKLSYDRERRAALEDCD